MKRLYKTARSVLTAALATATVTLLAAASYGQDTATTAPATPDAQDLPSAKDLYAKHIEAIGGEDALRKIKSRRMVGIMQIPAMALEAPVVALSAAPNKMLMTIDMSGMGMGEQRQGYDGTVAWSMSPMQGEMVFEGELLEQVQRESDFYPELNVERLFQSIRTVGKEEYNGKSAYKVERMSGEKSSYVYFDAETGLLLGGSQVDATPMGDVATVMTIDEYKEFDGVKVATKSNITQAGTQIVLNFTNVEHNVVDPTVFELPPAIAAKVAAGKNAKPADPETGDDTKEDDNAGDDDASDDSGGDDDDDDDDGA